MYRQRFALTAQPLPKDAQGRSFFEHGPGYPQLQRAFARLASEPGLGLLTGEAGVGKTAAMRNLCAALPRPDYQVLYLCDTAISPLDLYRTLADALGVRPSHRRAQLWSDIKKALLHLRDERHTAPIVILDEAQHLSERFLVDLAGFLNFAFDSRDVLTLWLLALPALRRRLQMHHHAPLAMRISAHVHLEPFAERDAFAALISHAFSAAGATEKLLADPALEMLHRASRGLPRLASSLLRTALHIAHEREQRFLDERIVEQAIDEMLPALHP